MSPCKSLVAAVLLAMLGLRFANAQDAPIPEGSFVVRNARMFDGHATTQRTDVLVQNGRIAALGHHLKTSPQIPTIDANGGTLLPGLIDSHTHAYGNALEEALIFGVTTELDMFTDPQIAAVVKREQAAGKGLNLADLRSAGTLATVPGGHGTEYGVKIPTLTSPDEAQAWVDARIQEGSDYIKLVYDDYRAYGTQRPTLSKETMRAVIEAAHRRGKMAVVHIGDQQGAIDAIEAGVDGLAHLFADSAPLPRFSQIAAAHHIFVIPTLTVLESVSGVPGGASLATDPRLQPYLSQEDIANLRRTFPKFRTHLDEHFAEEAVYQLEAQHVPILAGTDSPNPGTSHGASIHRELELLVRAGMTPEQALSAATSVPAATFHLEDRGVIAAGKRADLLLVKGDPTRDITATRNIVAVWKAGVPANRTAYMHQLAEQKDRARVATEEAARQYAESGLISNFESGELDTTIGAGWSVSTDVIAGGKSSAALKVIPGGAANSKYALDISGKIDDGLPFAWAGAMLSPGDRPFAPKDLSAKKALSFWAKGDGKTYRIMLFTEAGGRVPFQKTFTATTQWEQFSFPFSAFAGMRGNDVTAVLFVGGPTAGRFDLQIDELSLK